MKRSGTRELWSSVGRPGHRTRADSSRPATGKASCAGPIARWTGGANAKSNPRYAPSDRRLRRTCPKIEVVPYWDDRQAVRARRSRRFASISATAASWRINTSVAAYASHAVDYPVNGTWGCEGGKRRHTRAAAHDAGRTGERIDACFEQSDDRVGGRRSGRQLALLRRRDLRRRRYVVVVIGSGSARSTSGATGAPTYQSTRAVSLRCRTQAELAAITWITPTWETSDHPSVERSAWTGLDRERRQRGRRGATFRNRRRSSSCWDDWGGWFDPVHADSQGLRRVRVFACRC